MLKQITYKQKPPVRLNAYFLFCVFMIIVFPLVSLAQDKIYKTDRTYIEVKVQEIGVTEIKYKKFSNPYGPTYIILKKEVWMIVYENGEKEVYEQKLNNQQETSQSTNPVPFAVYGKTGDHRYNDDVIYTANGDSIACTIDRVTKAKIFYKIRRRGYGPRGTISVEQITKYFYQKQWYDAYGYAISKVNSLNEKARNYIIKEYINEAIATYSYLIAKDTMNAILLAEDAYALALGGIYDAALMRLDRCWSIDANSPDVNYLTGQVFALMGYDDITNEIWKSSEKYKAPAWISSKAAILLQKYRHKLSSSSKTDSEEIIAKFKKANEMASQSLYFQSIAMFHEIINLYPNEYLPYVGYSITLEKTGAFENSAQSLDKAISLIGNNSENIEEKRILKQHLVTIKRKLTSLPPGAMPGLHRRNVLDAFSPQMMAFGGFMLSPSLTSINGRIGYYISEGSNASFDFGIGSVSNASFSNIGLSLYSREKYLVVGGGLMMNSGGGNTAFSLKISVGVSKMNKNRKSSFDVFLDVYSGLKRGSLATFSISFGSSLYFGKRK